MEKLTYLKICRDCKKPYTDRHKEGVCCNRCAAIWFVNACYGDKKIKQKQDENGNIHIIVGNNNEKHSIL